MTRGWRGGPPPGPSHPEAPSGETTICVCQGNGCRTCAGSGLMPAWVNDPEITGYPHERRDGR